MPKKNTPPYALIDSGNGFKLEQFGPRLLSRPSAQALWAPRKPDQWNSADLFFDRQEGARWQLGSGADPSLLSSDWITEVQGLLFRLQITDFGHVGLFPEHAFIWKAIEAASLKYKDTTRTQPPKALNLFGYSGGATLKAAQCQYEVVHVDASKGMTHWARQNAALNKLEHRTIHWIVEDAIKFVRREVRRQKKYEVIILDPPSFGRGSQGELFKIEEDLLPLLEACVSLLSTTPHLFALTCHTPGLTPHLLQNLLMDLPFPCKGTFSSGELLLPSHDSFSIPSGTYVFWQPS
jgi:23S rRNA (cytosine1962-C5)-methyltransferase